MFAIGHFALGYLAGKGSSRLLKVKFSFPLLLVVSVLPDIDLILQFINPALFMHRGPTHSIITFTVLIVPLFLIFGKQALPYYAVALSHSLIGDFFTGGIEMFWPLSNGWFGLNFSVRSLGSVLAELILFATTITIMLRNNELQTLWEAKETNFMLLIAFGAVLGPLLSVGRGSEASLPALLDIPSIIWLIIFGYSIFVGLRGKPEKFKKTGKIAEAG
jgi:membrane-bound metal-dependent hydrolase YbcI (DUF457 family)